MSTQSTEEETWAVIQPAPSRDTSAKKMVLALVDRKINNNLWWTAEDPDIVVRFYKKYAAENSASRLKGSIVVSFDTAFEMISDQRAYLQHEAFKNS